MKRKIAILGLVNVLALSSFSFAAEDELLNILDGKGKSTPEKEADAIPTSPLRKMVGKATAEQNIFFSHFEKSDFEASLFQWASAFENTTFAKSASGQALRAFILFQTGLTLTGLEDLLMIEDAKKVDPFVLGMWRSAAPDSHPAWGQLWVQKWNASWTEVFGVNAEIRVRSRQLDGFENMALVKDLMSKSKPGTRERGLLQWQLILALINEDTGKAAQALAHLMKQENNPIGVDLLSMTAARMLFQNGFMDAAIKYYEKVPKSSDYWFEAQEEMAWSHLRKAAPHEALAITKTLNQPYFAVMSGPEATFLRSLAQLKVCDYTGVVATINGFRRDFRDRTAALVQIGKDANTPDVKDLLKKRGEGKIKFVEMGPTLKNIPRWAPRDQMLGSLITYEQILAKEAVRAGQLYAKSMSLGSDRVGFQGDMENLKNKTEARRRSAEVQAMKRVQVLAATEVKETQEILSKLHIVEAEMLQQGTMVDRVTSAKNGKSSELKAAKGEPAKFQIKYPAESEIWFDELSNFNVSLKGGCEVTRKE